MSILKPAETTQACAKINIQGFSGTGKTHAAVHIAMGIIERIGSKKPLAFFDTETGSDFFIDRLKARGISMLQAKTRAFSDLVDGLKEAQSICDVAIVDSVTHYWRELSESYMRSKALAIMVKKREIESVESALASAAKDTDYTAWLDGQVKRYKPKQPAFPDWQFLKGEWNIFTDIFVNCPMHMIICGRGGFEYDFTENDEGKLELRKTGTKMKAENEFGFEPSLVLEAERQRRSEYYEDPKAEGFIHTITVLKDRCDKINGQCFIFDPMKMTGENGSNPVFASLLPHIELLNMGGAQLGVDTSRTSDKRFPDGDGEYERQKKVKAVLLEEIQGIISENFNSQKAEDKKIKMATFNTVFGTRSWEAVEGKSVAELRACTRALVAEINKLRAAVEADPIELPSIALEGDTSDE